MTWHHLAMGLAIGVGILADLLQHDPEGATWVRADVAAIDTALRDEGVASGWSEPETLSSDLPRHACTSFPYSFLHYLRRAFAHVYEDRPVPDDDELRPEHDAVVEDASTMFDSHLLCHSDAEGYYVPVDFSEPIFGDAIPGGMLGSSQGLLRELQRVAPALAIELVDGAPTPAVEAALRTIEDSGPLWRERLVWYALFEAATLSIRQRTLIAFH